MPSVVDEVAKEGRTGGDRTRDPNIKSVVLYQLSYSPNEVVKRGVLYHIRQLEINRE